MTTTKRATSAHSRSAGRTEISAEIGSMVRKRRTESGLSAKTVAEYLGVTTQVLEAYETGKRKIPMHHIYALSNYLDISPAKILKLLHQD